MRVPSPRSGNLVMRFCAEPSNSVEHGRGPVSRHFLLFARLLMTTPAPRSETFDDVRDIVVAGHVVLVLGRAYLRLLGADAAARELADVEQVT